MKGEWTRIQINGSLPMTCGEVSHGVGPSPQELRANMQDLRAKMREYACRIVRRKLDDKQTISAQRDATAGERDRALRAYLDALWKEGQK